ncbi:MAG: L,D-transpeptidase family protein [Candidatus Aminicenantales bacterium]
MKISWFTGAACALGLIYCLACNTPPVPPEAARAIALEQDLWRAGGSLFTPREYESFKDGLKEAGERIGAEESKFGWFRDYRPVQAELKRLVTRGDALLSRINTEKDAKARTFAISAEALAARIEGLYRITEYFNENDDVRKNVAQAEIKLAEARLLVGKEKYELAAEIAGEGGLFLDRAEEVAVRLLRRYLDGDQRKKWSRLAEEAVEESKAKSSVVLVVNKIERKMIVYKEGEGKARFDIGLGKYGLSDKLQAGDEATPEGRYRIVKKFNATKFYKALLIDYPNEEDRRTFAEAKKLGLIPGGANIGGEIEIHGGGKDCLTRGCVGLENKDMDDVFAWVDVGATVIIVGATRTENTILMEIEKYKKNAH